MLSAAGSASAGRKGWPPQRRSTGSAGAFTTTTSQASVALRSLSPAFNWSATAVLPYVVRCRSVVTLVSQGTDGDPILPLPYTPNRGGGVPHVRRTALISLRRAPFAPDGGYAEGRIQAVTPIQPIRNV